MSELDHTQNEYNEYQGYQSDKDDNIVIIEKRHTDFALVSSGSQRTALLPVFTCSAWPRPADL